MNADIFVFPHRNVYDLLIVFAILLCKSFIML